MLFHKNLKDEHEVVILLSSRLEIAIKKIISCDHLYKKEITTFFLLFNKF